MQPFFHELRMDITVSEPDEPTGSREDLISSLDALHEDMYFVGGDYFKNYGIQKAGVMLDAPGLILPVIHQKEGRPVFRVTLTEPLKDAACITKDGETAAAERKRSEVETWISAVSWENGELNFHITVKGAAEATVEAYAALWSKGVLENAAVFLRKQRLSLKQKAAHRTRHRLRSGKKSQRRNGSRTSTCMSTN